MTKKIHKASFDPMLFNGLGSKRERRWNNALYSIISIEGILSVPIGLFIFNGVINKLYYDDWFLVAYMAFMLNFLVFFILWCYVHIVIFKHTYTNKHINKSDPLLICEYKGSLKNYCVWVLGFLYLCIIYSFIILLSIFAQPLIAVVLMHIFISKPFLLKRILLFEEYLILEYRIFGNIKLNRDNLALMPIPRPSTNLAFVRPQLFDQDKFPHIIANFCTRFNPFGMNNISTLIKELDSKMGYSAYEMTKNKITVGFEIKNLNCLKIYL
ncbi:hypothetical protein [Campylobacter troglodytis]|uniref:hypothetical protein n=1 Tax=Campylobacter troglodytis TaxID=654363 RepID=UPI00115A79B4|nr:hypothetical protein [Campylobacter troglodytis]TQR60541.1 hypothetical protein DMC01_05200 [Campylobacter troglodytis]